MAEFTPDPAFVQRAVLAIRHLEHLVTTLPRASHRLDRIVSDLDSVGKRYVRGAHCFSCEASTPLPVITHAVFCSEDCRRLDSDRNSQVEARVQEALAEHVDPEVPTL
jgi:predicted nucleic acid-binding Zn ribbon protein